MQVNVTSNELNLHFSIPGRIRDFSLCRHVQTGSGILPDSDDTEESFCRDKVVKA